MTPRQVLALELACGRAEDTMNLPTMILRVDGVRWTTKLTVNR